MVAIILVSCVQLSLWSLASDFFYYFTSARMLNLLVEQCVLIKMVNGGCANLTSKEFFRIFLNKDALPNMANMSVYVNCYFCQSCRGRVKGPKGDLWAKRRIHILKANFKKRRKVSSAKVFPLDSLSQPLKNFSFRYIYREGYDHGGTLSTLLIRYTYIVFFT